MLFSVTQRLTHPFSQPIRGLFTMALLLASVGVLPACDYNNTKALSDRFQNPSGQQEAQDKEGVFFEEVRLKILEPKCVSCHNTYRNFEAAKSEANAILAAIESGRMPKRGPALDEEQTRIVRDWVAGGARNRPNSETNNLRPTEPSELVPTWESLSSKVFFPRCVVCHNPNGEAKFLDLSSRQKFFEQRNREFIDGKLLDFELPESSYLVTVVTDPNEPMPPVGSSLPGLSEKEIETLKEWIRLGLP